MMLTPVFALSILFLSQADEAKDEARKLMNRGNQAFALDDYEGALADFQKAYETYPSPKILLNLAETHRALERWAEAVSHYEKFLAEASQDDEMVAQVESRIAELEEKVGRIEIAAEEVEVTIDGEAIEGSRAVVAPGQYQVIVKKEGYHDFTRMVAVAAGQTETLEVQMEELPSVAPPPPPLAIETEPKQEDDAVTGKGWFWAGTGAAVLAVVGISLAVAFSTGGDGFVPTGELPRVTTTDWESF